MDANNVKTPQIVNCINLNSMKEITNLIFCRISIVLSIILITGLNSCSESKVEKKKIVYVNSYHKGFPPSDDISSGVYETLPADSFEIISYFMDTKRNSSQEYILSRAAELLDSIKAEKPDLLIASDDNAVKYLVEPNFKESPVPIVFCGVNWTSSQYDLGENVTGILEILPVAELLQIMRFYYPSMQKLLVLNENTTTSRKTKPILDTLGAAAGVTVTQELVDDFESWKEIFKDANQSYDLIYLQTRGAIKNWNHDEALQIIDEHIKIPLLTCESFMMPYAVLGLTQLSKEQGILAAEKAKKILEGGSPADIPVSQNQMFKVWINKRLAEKIHFQPNEELLSKAKIVN